MHACWITKYSNGVENAEGDIPAYQELTVIARNEKYTKYVRNYKVFPQFYALRHEMSKYDEQWKHVMGS